MKLAELFRPEVELNILQQAANGIRALHDKGIVHRGSFFDFANFVRRQILILSFQRGVARSLTVSDIATRNLLFDGDMERNLKEACDWFGRFKEEGGG